MKHRGRRAQRRKPRGGRTAVLAVIAAAAIAAGVTLYNKSADPSGPLPVHLPITPQSYLGIYNSQFPASYAKVTEFAQTTGAKPDLAMFYSGWSEGFPVRFASTAASNGVVPVVQMDPDGISVAAIASGRYDAYLSLYAEAVRAYHNPVILSFGH
jgi:hypothetical protein